MEEINYTYNIDISERGDKDGMGTFSLQNPLQLLTRRHIVSVVTI